ncbi:Methyltetrahydroprotoberberine 14-monooxygenase [Linum grandiflorum]
MRLCGEFVSGDMVSSLGWLNWLPGPVQSMKRIAGKLDEVMESWIEGHKLKRTHIDQEVLVKGEQLQQSDFIDVMLSKIYSDFCEEYSPETVIKATAMTLILAGAETTFVTMTWMLSNFLTTDVQWS